MATLRALLMKYKSITTPDIEHDNANMIVEFIWLNRDLQSDMFPWRGDAGREWGRLVASVKKLMKDPYGLSCEQLAFYVYKCAPQTINPPEFAKMAVVARKLFKRYDLEEVRGLYIDKRRRTAPTGLENIPFKQEKPKTLLTFLRELERGEE